MQGQRGEMEGKREWREMEGKKEWVTKGAMMEREGQHARGRGVVQPISQWKIWTFQTVGQGLHLAAIPSPMTLIMIILQGR